MPIATGATGASSIAAVTAHEITHIANGDMVTMALVQSVINTVIDIITIPLWFSKWAAFFSDEVSAPSGI